MPARKLTLIKMPAFTGEIKAVAFTDKIILASFWYSALSGLVFSSRSLRKCLYLREKEQFHFTKTHQEQQHPLLVTKRWILHQEMEYTPLSGTKQLLLRFLWSHSFYLQICQLHYPTYFIHLQAFGVSWGAGKSNLTYYWSSWDSRSLQHSHNVFNKKTNWTLWTTVWFFVCE